MVDISGLLKLIERISITDEPKDWWPLMRDYFTYLNDNYIKLLPKRSYNTSYYINNILYEQWKTCETIEDLAFIFWRVIPPVFVVSMHQDFSEPTCPSIKLEHWQKENHHSGVPYEDNPGSWRIDQRTVTQGLAIGVLYCYEYLKNRPELHEDLFRTYEDRERNWGIE